MEIVKILGVAFITAVVSILIKATKPELSFAVMITGSIIILLFLIDNVKGTIIAVQVIAQESGIENGLLKLLLKIIGVGYISDFGAGILNDFGSNSLADKVILGGKIAIVLLALPIIENLLFLIKGFVELI